MRATLAYLQCTPKGQFWFHVLCAAGEGQKLRGLFGVIRAFPRDDKYEPDASLFKWRVHLLGKDFVVGTQARKE